METRDKEFVVLVSPSGCAISTRGKWKEFKAVVEVIEPLDAEIIFAQN